VVAVLVGVGVKFIEFLGEEKFKKLKEKIEKYLEELKNSEVKTPFGVGSEDEKVVTSTISFALYVMEREYTEVLRKLGMKEENVVNTVKLFDAIIRATAVVFDVFVRAINSTVKDEKFIDVLLLKTVVLPDEFFSMIHAEIHNQIRIIEGVDEDNRMVM